jgi:hypothetical protein
MFELEGKNWIFSKLKKVILDQYQFIKFKINFVDVNDE